MDSPTMKEKAGELLKSYKIEIIKTLEWFNQNKNNFVKGKNFVIINAEDNVKDSMIGTLCGIILGSNVYNKNFVIVGMAYSVENDIKISMRTNNPNIDLREIISNIAQGGGHSNSCGAFISKKEEQTFINAMKDVLTKAL